MFNRKKREIERLRAANKDLLCQLGNATTRYSHEVRELQDRLYEEREACAALTSENEKLRQFLAAVNDQAAQAQADRRRLQGENRALLEKIEEAQRHSTCPADCVHRTNPNACRTCTRYPKARDKYEVGNNAEEICNH